MLGLDLGNLVAHLRLDDVHYTSGLKRAERLLHSTSRRLEQISIRYAKRLGIVVAGYLAVSTKAYASFEEQMAFVGTMLDEQSMRLLPSYGKSVKRMAVEFGEGTATITRGLYDILSASVAPEKAMKVLDASIRAAKSGMTSTAVSADAITTILNAYSLSADKAADVSDLLFAIVKRGKTTFAELAPSIGMVAAMAANAGMSLEDLGAALATMTRAGLRTEIAVTALRGLVNIFLDATPEATKAAKALGIELKTATLRQQGLISVLEKMRRASPEQIAAIIGERRALAGFSAVLRQLDSYLYDYNIMLERAGMTQEAYEKMTDTLMHTFRRYWQAVKITSVEIGSHLAPMVERATKAMMEFLSSHQIEIAIGIVKALEGITRATEKFISLISKVPAYWAAWRLGIAEIKLDILKLADAWGVVIKGPVKLWEVMGKVPGLGLPYRKMAETVREHFVVPEKEIKQTRIEVEELTKRMDELADAAVSRQGDIESFFKTVTAPMEQAKLKLAADKALRDFKRGWESLKETYKPLVDTFSTLKNQLLDIAGISRSTTDSLKDIAGTTENMATDIEPVTRNFERIQQMLNELKIEYELLGKITEERERAMRIAEFQVLVEKELGKSTEASMYYLQQYTELIDKLIEGRRGPSAFTEKLRTWHREASNIWSNLGDIAAGALDRTADALANMVMRGKADIKSLAQSAIADFTRMFMRFQMAQALGFVFPQLAAAPMAVAAMPTVGTITPEAGATLARYQEGGWAMYPQVAKLAEKEPELVTPLSKMGTGLTEYHVHYHGQERPKITSVEEYALSDRRIVEVTMKAMITNPQYAKSIKQASKR